MYLLLILLVFSLQNNIFSMGEGAQDEAKQGESWQLDLEAGEPAGIYRIQLLSQAESDNNPIRALKHVSNAMAKNMRELKAELRDVKDQQTQKFKKLNNFVSYLFLLGLTTLIYLGYK